MQQIRRAAVAGVAIFAIGADAGSALREPVHLALVPDADETAPWKATLESSIANLAAPPMSAAVQTKDVNVEKKGEEKEKEKSKLDQPVQVQVPDNEMQGFISTLSTDCGGRFQQMLQGKGGDLHKFGSHGMKADDASCTKLEGTMCHTQAHIIHQKKTMTNGRKSESSMDVAGNSCLPRQCMAKSDLDRLATFMHTQAKNIVPGAEHRVELSVDCSKNGGASATIGAKSGSSAMTSGAAALAVMLAFTRFA